MHLNWLFFIVCASMLPSLLWLQVVFQLKTLNFNFHLILLLSHWASRGNTVWSAMNHLPKASSRLLSLLLNTLGSFIFWFICIYENIILAQKEYQCIFYWNSLSTSNSKLPTKHLLCSYSTLYVINELETDKKYSRFCTS